MTHVEIVIKNLHKAGKAMASGKFSSYDLTFIKATLEKFLAATNKIIDKIEQKK